MITKFADQINKLSFAGRLSKIHPLLREKNPERCVTNSVHRWNCGQSVCKFLGGTSGLVHCVACFGVSFCSLISLIIFYCIIIHV